MWIPVKLLFLVVTSQENPSSTFYAMAFFIAERSKLRRLRRGGGCGGHGGTITADAKMRHYRRHYWS